MQRIGFNNLAQIESNMVHQNQYPAREYMHLTYIYLSQTIQSRQILQQMLPYTQWTTKLPPNTVTCEIVNRNTAILWKEMVNRIAQQFIEKKWLTVEQQYFKKEHPWPEECLDNRTCISFWLRLHYEYY